VGAMVFVFHESEVFLCNHFGSPHTEENAGEGYMV
jgi:hypothetical protein